MSYRYKPGERAIVTLDVDVEDFDSATQWALDGKPGDTLRLRETYNKQHTGREACGEVMADGRLRLTARTRRMTG